MEVEALEALGESRKRKLKKTIIWSEDLKETVERKNGTYRHFLATGENEDSHELHRLTNIVKSKTKGAQQKRWDRFISDLENDIGIYGLPIVQSNDGDTRDVANLQTINNQDFLQYFTMLWSE